MANQNVTKTMKSMLQLRTARRPPKNYPLNLCLPTTKTTYCDTLIRSQKKMINPNPSKAKKSIFSLRQPEIPLKFIRFRINN